MRLSKYQPLLLLCLTTLFFAPWASAADKIELRDADLLLARINDARSLQPLTHEAALQNVLGMGRETTLQLVSCRSDRFGLTHSRYLTLYRGVPVWGHQVVMTEGDGKIVRMHGVAIVGLENDVPTVEPALDAATALEVMKKSYLEGKTSRNVFYENEKSELVIYIDGQKGRLSYAVNFFADVEEGGEPARPYYIVDADSREVLLQFEGLTTENGTGPGGNEKTGRYRYGAEYPPFNVAFASGYSTMENEYVKTVNLNHSSSGSTTYKYQGSENTVKTINGAFSPLNDAHYFGEVVFKMYKEWYNTAPLSFKLTMRVHYGNSYENAFWNGSSMTFGDGKTRFYPLVSLDVSAHEVSHGFTEQNSGLAYYNQSGGINEAFSDIAGEASEYYMHNRNDWMVGAQIFKSTGALRYLDNPPKDGKSIGSAKDYRDGMDVHYSSGVYNKAFYLLATKPGWNTRKAFDVFVKANRDYWTSGSTFSTGAKGVMDAAKDYGYSIQDVKDAFSAVDVQTN